MYFHRLSKSCVPANQIIGENCRVKRETCSWGAKVNAIRMLNIAVYPKLQKTNESIKIYDRNIRINHIDSRYNLYLYILISIKYVFVPKCPGLEYE